MSKKIRKSLVIWSKETTLGSSQRRFFTSSGVIPTVTAILKFQRSDATWEMERGYKLAVIITHWWKIKIRSEVFHYANFAIQAKEECILPWRIVTLGLGSGFLVSSLVVVCRDGWMLYFSSQCLWQSLCSHSRGIWGWLWFSGGIALCLVSVFQGFFAIIGKIFIFARGLYTGLSFCGT